MSRCPDLRRRRCRAGRRRRSRCRLPWRLSRARLAVDDVGVLLLDGVKRRAFIEMSHRVPTEQFEIVGTAQLVPQCFEANRRCFATLFPEQIDHLPVRPDGAMLASATNVCEDLPQRAPECAGVRHAVRHEELERLARIECYELALTLQGLDGGAAAAQARLDARG